MLSESDFWANKLVNSVKPYSVEVTIKLLRQLSNIVTIFQMKMRRRTASSRLMFGLKSIRLTKVSSIQIIIDWFNFSVNLHHEYMDLSMTLSMMWTDERLEWNKTDFSGVDYVQAAAENIWYPDLEVQNRLLAYPPGDEKLTRTVKYGWQDFFVCVLVLNQPLLIFGMTVRRRRLLFNQLIEIKIILLQQRTGTLQIAKQTTKEIQVRLIKIYWNVTALL